MKRLLFIYVALVAFSATAFAEVQTYALNVREFTKLQVIDDLNVLYKSNPDSAGLAVFTCENNVVRAIMFSNNNDKLKIEKNLDDDMNVEQFPLITVYSTNLIQADNCGDSLLIVESPAPGSVLKAKVIGNGSLVVNNIHSTQVEGALETGRGYLEMNGITRNVKLKNIGTGKINATALEAETGTVTVLGTGPVACFVTEELTVKGMGTGKVSVKGSPKVKKRSIGSIEVLNIE